MVYVIRNITWFQLGHCSYKEKEHILHLLLQWEECTLRQFCNVGCTFSLRSPLMDIKKSQVTLTSVNEWGIALLMSFRICPSSVYKLHIFFITMCTDSYLNECLVGSMVEQKQNEKYSSETDYFFFYSKKVSKFLHILFHFHFLFFWTVLFCTLVWP